MTDTVPMPECEKMRAVHDQSQAIGEFLDWLTGPADEEGRGLVLAEYITDYTDVCRHDWHEPHSFGWAKYWSDEETCPSCGSTDLDTRLDAKYRYDPPQLWAARVGGFNKLLAEYFKIDLDKVEAERSALLDALRA